MVAQNHGRSVSSSDSRVYSAPRRKSAHRSKRPSARHDASDRSPEVVPPESRSTAPSDVRAKLLRKSATPPVETHLIESREREGSESLQDAALGTNEHFHRAPEVADPQPLIRLPPPKHSRLMTAKKLAAKEIGIPVRISENESTPFISKPIKAFDPVRPPQIKKRKELFHVRVSLGNMIGLRMEQIIKKNKKREMSPRLVVGYAALPKSNKQISFSQPLVPNIGKNKPQRLHWASPRRRPGQSSASKSKRVLYFALELDRYDNSATAGDDGSVGSVSSFVPDVVKIVVGLRCGDERFPLGIANLVVDGRNAMNHRVDLSVRPISDISEIIPTRNKPKRHGIFGSSKKQLKNSFSSDDFSYRLASNASLRIKVDVLANSDAVDPDDIWGHLNFDDESSCLTNWSLSASSANRNNDSRQKRAEEKRSPDNESPPFTVEPQLPVAPERELPEPGKIKMNQKEIPLPEIVVKPKLRDNNEANSAGGTLSSEWIEVMPRANGSSVVASSKLHADASRIPTPPGSDEQAERSFSSSRPSESKRLMQKKEKMPVEYVFFPPSKDGSSLVSRLTESMEPPGGVRSSFLVKACMHITACGDDSDYFDEQQSFSYDSLIDRGYSSSMNASHRSRKGDSRSEYSPSAGSATRKKRRSRKKTRKHDAFDNEATVPFEKESSTIAEADRLADDISLDTYTDLKDAQATLIRYARKVGVNMEDLLDGSRRAKLLRAVQKKEKMRGLQSDTSHV